MFNTNLFFPTVVTNANIGREITKEELAKVDYYKNNTIINRGNCYSKNTYILDEEFGSIKQFIQSGIDHYVETVLCAKDLKLRITQSWLNYTEPGEYHHEHTHPNSVISGVFYFNVDPNLDRIKFLNYKTNHFDFIVNEWNLLNAEEWLFSVNIGELFLFPSSLKHVVEQTTNNITRISLAFNTFPTSTFGNRENLTELRFS